jgi:hypothetical protein
MLSSYLFNAYSYRCDFFTVYYLFKFNSIASLIYTVAKLIVKKMDLLSVNFVALYLPQMKTFFLRSFTFENL